MVLSHGPNPRHQVLANVSGAGFLLHLGGQMITALGGGFVEGALEQIQGGVDLTGELIFSEQEGIALFAHVNAYIYAHFKA